MQLAAVDPVARRDGTSNRPPLVGVSYVAAIVRDRDCNPPKTLSRFLPDFATGALHKLLLLRIYLTKLNQNKPRLQLRQGGSSQSRFARKRGGDGVRDQGSARAFHW